MLIYAADYDIQGILALPIVLTVPFHNSPMAGCTVVIDVHFGSDVGGIESLDIEFEQYVGIAAAAI